jgi:hypothetical protein
MAYYEQSQCRASHIVERNLLMAYTIRHLETESKIGQQVSLEMMHEIIPRELILQALQQERSQEERERRLPMLAVVCVLMARILFPHDGFGKILRTLWDQLRYLYPDPTDEQLQAPTPGAFTYRRQQLRPKALQRLFHTLCHPRATPQTPGAFAFGRRLMALDSSLKSVADSHANAKVFGRCSGGKGRSAFPQVRISLLAECGTHLVIDAVFAPSRPSEQHGARRLLRSLQAGMLLLWDCGYHGYPLLWDLKQTGADLLAALPSSDQPEVVERLSDGTSLVRVWKRKDSRKDPAVLMRLIEYSFTDPALPSCEQKRRLLTTLLDPQEAPAVELIALYHERWEVERVVAELEHLYPFLQARMRSQTPCGVIQELYGLLLGHYCVRALMLQAAEQAQLDVDRLSYDHAVQTLSLALPRLQAAQPSCKPHLLACLWQDLLTGRVAPRGVRSYPRVVKRRSSPFACKKPIHAHPPQPEKHKTLCHMVRLI